MQYVLHYVFMMCSSNKTCEYTKKENKKGRNENFASTTV